MTMLCYGGSYEDIHDISVISTVMFMTDYDCPSSLSPGVVTDTLDALKCVCGDERRNKCLPMIRQFPFGSL